MSKIYADTIETDNPNVDITLGAAGDVVLLPSGATLKTNSIKDAGGNTIFTSDGSGTLSSVNSTLSSGNEKFVLSQTASATQSVAFTGIDNTYSVYIFRFSKINPSVDNTIFMFQVSIDAGSTYGVTAVNICAVSQNAESGGGSFAYNTSYDQGYNTDYRTLGYSLGNAADESAAGEMHLFMPNNTSNASTTANVKMWYGVAQMSTSDTYSKQVWSGGYFDTTSSIDAVNFKVDSGTFDGIITMYGLTGNA